MQPKIAQRYETQTLANVLDTHSLIVRENGAACHGLDFRVLILDLTEKLVKVFDLISTDWLVVLHVRLERFARKLVFDERHADSLRNMRDDLHAHRLEHVTVQLCGLGWMKIRQADEFVSVGLALDQVVDGVFSAGDETNVLHFGDEIIFTVQNRRTFVS